MEDKILGSNESDCGVFTMNNGTYWYTFTLTFNYNFDYNNQVRCSLDYPS